RVIENHVKNDQARASPKQAIQQKRPDLSRPRKRPLSHQFKRAITRDFLLTDRLIQLQRLLIDSQKNEVVVRRSFPALSAQQILETLFATPGHRDERQCWEKVAGKNHRRPKQTHCGKGQTTMACKPVHSKILKNCTGTANLKGRL